MAIQRSRRHVLFLPMCLGLTFPAVRAGAVAIRHLRIALGSIAEPDYAVRSSAGGGPQYDSRTFVPEGGGEALTFAQAMAGENVQLGRELSIQIAKTLSERGYHIVGNGAGGTDVKLAVAFDPRVAVYSDEVLGDDLMPGFGLSVVLDDAKSGKRLSGTRILYGQARERSAHTLYPDARYRFTSADALLADPRTAAEGFRAGLAAAATEIAKVVGR